MKLLPSPHRAIAVVIFAFGVGLTERRANPARSSSTGHGLAGCLALFDDFSAADVGRQAWNAEAAEADPSLSKRIAEIGRTIVKQPIKAMR